MNRHETNVFQWTFEIKDVVKFEETSITITFETYEQEKRKIRGIKTSANKDI